MSGRLECFVNLVSFGELQQLVTAHGYWAVALIVGLESMGLPLPGETILVLAAIYAATEPSFNIWVVIAVAAFGAIVGDNAGYWLGLRYGYALLLRYGERIGMFEARIKLGQYLYLKHGAKVVFLGRFVALLRILAAFLAGVNRMPWRAFLVANACGGIIWAAVFGIGERLTRESADRYFDHIAACLMQPEFRPRCEHSIGFIGSLGNQIAD